MNYLIRLLKWALLAWPVLLFALIITLHLMIISNIAGPTDFVNKIAGTLLQLIGGLIVLYSINANLGVFRKKNLYTAFKMWILEFPRLHVHQVIHAATGNAIAGGVAAGISAYITGGSLEERMMSLERRLDETNLRISTVQKEQRERMEVLSGSFTSSLSSTKLELRELASKVEEATVGGFKQQLFGVLIAIYGALINLAA